MRTLRTLAAGAALTAALLARAEPPHEPSHDHALHQQHADTAGMTDSRTVVHFPEDLRTHTLANMRDHLRALQEIQAALAKADYEQAAAVAEQRLGMTSLTLHGAHEVGPYMPEPMRAIGQAMHQAASRFAVEAGNVGATGELGPALAALSRVTEQCVACHSAYRVQ